MKALKKIRSRNWSSHSHWFGYLLLTLFCIFQFALQGIVGILADSLANSFPLDASSLSLLSSSFYYSYILVQIPVGLVYDRLSARKVASAALLLVAVSCLAFAYAPTVGLAICARILMGLGCAFGFIGLVVGIGRWFAPKYFGLLLALSECMAMGGVAGFNGVFSRVLITHDWRFVAQICAAFALFLSLATLLFAKHDLELGKSKSISLKTGFATILRSKEVWLGGLFAFAVFSIFTVFIGLWAIPLFMNAAKLDLVQASSVVSMTFLGIAISSPIVGWLATFIRASSLMLVGSVCVTFWMFVILYFPQSTMFGNSLLMFGLGFVSAVYEIPFSIINRVIAPAVRGAAMGMTNMITMLSAPLLQPLIAWLLMHFGGGITHSFESYPLKAFQAGLVVIPIITAIAALLTFGLQEKNFISLSAWLRKTCARILHK